MSTVPNVDRLRSLLARQGMTQADLVRASGISRAQIGRILSGRQDQVRQSTLDRLARALHVDAADVSAGGVLGAFRKRVAQAHAELDFRGIGNPHMQKQPIEKVFVDLMVREEVRETDEAGDGCSPVGSCSCTERPLSRQPIAATECIGTHDRVILLGDPGAGKTTVLRFLANTYATSTEPDGEIPIYVRLPELCRAMEVDEQVDPVRFVARAGDKPGPDLESALREALSDEKRCCLVLLDGLDEVGSEEQRERLIGCIDLLIDQYPRNRFAVTSRIVGFESSRWRTQGFSVFRIAGYSNGQLEESSRKWAKILPRSENESVDDVAERLRTAIFANHRVRALARNPLILTILVLLNEARGGALPRRRVDLYQKVVDVFLDTWESNKQSADGLGDVQGINLDAREFRWLLSDLSLAMQKAERTLAARWWLVDRMQGYLQEKLGFEPEEAKDACDRIIRYLVKRTGLIEARGPDQFGFSHRTLQEYFASLGVNDEADASSSRDVTGCLRGYYFHPQWSEVVRLVAAQLTPPLAESLISAILDDPDPIGRFLRRGQLLALKCLSDGATVPNRRLVAGIFDSLIDLGKSRWLGITLGAIAVLKNFEGTRLEEQASQTVESILQVAKTDLNEEDYGCLDRWVHMPQIIESARQELAGDFKSEAAREVPVKRGDTSGAVFFLNGELLSEAPDRWYRSVCLLIEDPNKSPQLKSFLVHELGRRMATDRRARIRLRKILTSKEDACVRAACASALAADTEGRLNLKRLLRVLDQDDDSRVKRACATALRDAAAENVSVADRLMGILESSQPETVRCGAAKGLGKAALSQPLASEALQRVVSVVGESEELKASCARALEPQLRRESSSIEDLFRTWLDASDCPKLRRVAAQSLAMAVANERLEWDHGVVEKVEHILLNLEDPSPAALDSLEELAMAREIRRGLRLEHVLGASLRSVADRIELAFVFGSTARNRQTEESDIDLLVIGDVNLKVLSAPLREAERTLGRRINPAIYTRDSFREKYHAGDPFLLDVYRREKLPVIAANGGSSQKELDDELRAMVADRLAHNT
ncbi:MAG: helix-turn-helix domain-containing protein [Planctomycetes bacterium]|nr:helix-turn-helix domain-containing protein [Planctomycetota bacterium]